MDDETYIFPDGLSGGDYVHSGGETFFGLRFTHPGGNPVNVLFNPQAAEHLAQQIAALFDQHLGGKPH